MRVRVQVNLGRTCPFWKTEGACMYESCAVAACTDDELPLGFRRVASAADCDHATHGAHGVLKDTVR